VSLIEKTIPQVPLPLPAATSPSPTKTHDSYLSLLVINKKINLLRIKILDVFKGCKFS